MISYDEAQSLVQNAVAAIAAGVCNEFIVIVDLTKEVEEGWVFFYDSEEFVDTSDPSSALAGNGPILVRRDGEVQILPSGVPWRVAVKDLVDDLAPRT